MGENWNNLDGFHDLFNDHSLLDYEENSEFLEWYSMENSKKISELSRQLRTFFKPFKFIIN